MINIGLNILEVGINDDQVVAGLIHLGKHVQGLLGNQAHLGGGDFGFGQNFSNADVVVKLRINRGDVGVGAGLSKPQCSHTEPCPHLDDAFCIQRGGNGRNVLPRTRGDGVNPVLQ